MCVFVCGTHNDIKTVHVAFNMENRLKMLHLLTGKKNQLKVQTGKVKYEPSRGKTNNVVSDQV